MADTRYLTTVVEDYVRSQLEIRYGVRFTKQRLRLRTRGHHEFDAVSDDRAIVASIKATSGRTAGGNLPQGKFNNALAEIYFLTLVEAPTRLLVLTNEGFKDLLMHRIAGALPDDVGITLVPLSETIQVQVDAVLAVASKEVSPQALEAAAEAEIDPLGGTDGADASTLSDQAR